MRNHWINWILFGVICLIWGSSFILMKAGLQGLSAYQVASLRVSSGALVLMPFAVSGFKKIPSSKFPIVFLTGFLGTFFPAFLFCIAETRIDSAIAGILNALTPLFTIIIAVMFFRSEVPVKKWLGVIIGFIGLSLLFVSGKQTISFEYLGYSLLVLIATVLYGLNVNLINRHLHGIRSIDIAAVSFSALLIPALAVLIYTGYFSTADYTRVWMRSTGAGVILGVAGTALGTLVFYSLIRRAGPVFSSMVTYCIPFVALGWGLFGGESIGLIQVLCLFVILGGVYLVNK